MSLEEHLQLNEFKPEGDIPQFLSEYVVENRDLDNEERFGPSKDSLPLKGVILPDRAYDKKTGEKFDEVMLIPVLTSAGEERYKVFGTLNNSKGSRMVVLTDESGELTPGYALEDEESFKSHTSLANNKVWESIQRSTRARKLGIQASEDTFNWEDYQRQNAKEKRAANQQDSAIITITEEEMSKIMIAEMIKRHNLDVRNPDVFLKAMQNLHQTQAEVAQKEKEERRARIEKIASRNRQEHVNAASARTLLPNPSTEEAPKKPGLFARFGKK